MRGWGKFEKAEICFLLVGGKCKQVWSEKAPIRPKKALSGLFPRGCEVRRNWPSPGKGNQLRKGLIFQAGFFSKFGPPFRVSKVWKVGKGGSGGP